MYYIRNNDNPGGSVELRLAIDAGSGREAADQSGVAHFVEHAGSRGRNGERGADRLISNEEIAAALLGTHSGLGETAEDYDGRSRVLDDLGAAEIGAFVSLAGQLGRFIEVRAVPR